MKLTQALKRLARRAGFEVFRLPAVNARGDFIPEGLPDAAFYQPRFSPWYGNGYGQFQPYLELAGPHTLVSADRLYVLWALGRHVADLRGWWYECGVYRGGSAALLVKLRCLDVRDHGVRLFDTFTGMPETDRERDWHKPGDFADTTLVSVQNLVCPLAAGLSVTFHPGFIPETFRGLEADRIAFCHCDLDIYRSIQDCCAFVYPRLIPGGVMVFDDYGFPTCPGARAAVDEFFADKPERPLVLPTGQAVMHRLPEG